MLQINQAETAKLHLQPQKLDLRQLYQEVLGQLNGRFKAKSQSLKTNLPADLPDVYADGDRIYQMLLNLLENAIKPVGFTSPCSFIDPRCPAVKA